MELLNQKQASTLFNLPPATLSTKIKKYKIHADGGTPGRPLYKKETLLKYFSLQEIESSDSVIISICNQKGGEMKTTLTQYLGQALAIKGKKVLLVDMDPQASLTSYFCNYPDKSLADLMGLTAVKANFSDVVVKISENINLLPSNIKLSAFSQIVKIKDYKRLFNVLNPVRSEYNFIILDCGPFLGPLLDNALTAADKVLIPVQCREYSCLGLDLLSDSINDIKEDLNPRLEILGAVLAFYDQREIMSEKKDEIGEFFTVLKTPIYKRASIPQNQATKEDYFKKHPKDAAMFLKLADEILQILEME